MDAVDETEARLDFARANLSAQIRARVAPSGALECDDCGEPIPEERRRAAPFATRCVECQERFERENA